MILNYDSKTKKYKYQAIFIFNSFLNNSINLGSFYCYYLNYELSLSVSFSDYAYLALALKF